MGDLLIVDGVQCCVVVELEVTVKVEKALVVCMVGGFLDAVVAETQNVEVVNSFFSP
jgi:hypothetical protein